MPELKSKPNKTVIQRVSLTLFFCLLSGLVFAADTTAPTGSLKINNNATYTNSTSVTLNLSATDTGTGVSEMKFSNNNSTWSLPEPYNTTKSWTILSGDGTKKVYVKYKDNAGNWSVAYYDTIILDATSPTGKILINNNAAQTNSASVTLNLSATDKSSGVSQMQFSNDNSNWSAPEAYATTKSWTILAGDGLKTVYVQYKDKAGNWSISYSDSIILDTTAPLISNVTATNIQVTTAQINWDTNEPATTQVEYGLTTAYGYKSALATSLVTAHSIAISRLKEYTLYHYRVISKDAVANQAISSDYTFTTKDTTAPTGSLKINNNATYTNSTSVTLNLSATDTGTGVSEMKFSNNNSTWSLPEPYNTTKSWTILSGDGLKTVYVKYKDNAGNWSVAYYDTIILDATSPTGKILINNNAAQTNSASVTLNLSATDKSSGVSQMQFSNDNSNWSAPEAYATTKSWTILAGDGLKTVYVQYKDKAGNWSISYSDTIVLDITPPTGTIKINNDVNYTNLTSVTLTLSVQDNEGGSGLDKMQFSNNNISWSTPIVYAGTTSWRLISGDGLKTVSVRYKDKAGNWSASYSDTIVLDTTAPVTPTVTDDGATTASTTQLHATWSASDSVSGISEYQYKITQDSSSGLTIVDWASTGTANEVTKTGLSLTNNKTYYFLVKAKNGAGLWSKVGYSDGIKISSDITPPTGTIKINNDVDYTNLTSVTLSLSAIDSGSGMGNGAQMRFSHDNSTWLAPEAYATTKTWTSTAGDGLKTVYVKFKDVAGNWSEPVSDTIILDTTAPTQPQGLSAIAGDTKIDLSWTANPETDIAGYNIYRSVNATTYTKINNTLITTNSYRDLGLSNGTTYYYKITAMDKAGNESVYSGAVSATPQGGLTESEPNNDFASADSININSFIGGTINPIGDEDYFKITTTKPGIISISLTNVPNNIDAYIYLFDSNYNYIGSSYSGGNGSDVNLQQELSSPGDYYISVFDCDEDNSSTSAYRLEVKLSSFFIYDVSHSPDCFSPNADGNQDSATIYASITASSNWTLNIKNSSGVIKRTFTGTGTSISQVWNGKDSSGAVVADGIYTYTIDATDPATGSTAPQVSGQVTVDNTKPTVLISQPTNNQKISGIFDIQGIAKDTNYYGYDYQCFLAYGEGAAPSDWKVLEWLYQPIEGPNGNPSLIYQWDTTKLPNGPYTLHLSVSDAAGNKSELKIVVNIYNVGVITYSDDPDPFSPNNDGRCDTTTITATLTMPANWTIKIKDKNNNVIRMFTGTASSISQAWDGRDSANTVPDGVYTYTIDTYDPALAKSGPQVSGSITVDTTKPTALISEPAVNALISGVVGIKGLAKDLNYNGYNYQCYLAYAKEISPNQEQILTYLYHPIVEDSKGKPPLIYSWDTSSLESGMYNLRLLVTDAAENSSEVLLPVHICKVNSYYAEPALFSPNGDGIKDTTNIVAVFSRLANWTISLENASHTVVRNFSGQSSSVAQIWDGKNGSGAVLPDGVYTFNINATEPGTGQNILTGSGNIEIDNTPPIANITQPVANSQVTGSVLIYGMADDLHYDGTESTLSWGEGTSPTQWNILANLTSPVPTESILTYWDTAGLKNGSYTLRLLIYDLVGNIKELRVPVKVYNVSILSYADAPDPFTPDSDGDKDTNTITASLSMLLDWEITITDKENSLIQQFNGSGDTISQVWDGKNTSTQVVADGVYNYRIEATDPATSISAQPVSDIITADTALPVALITSPVENDTVAGTVAIVGTASDNNLDNYIVEYGQGTAPSNWNLISMGYASVTNGALADWDSTKVTNGVYTLRLTATDVVGHTAQAQVKVTVDNIQITNVSVSPEVINPYNNETTTINYTLDRDANITIKLYDLDNNLKRTLIDTAPRFAGINAQTWDGKDDAKAIVPGHVYTITIEAQSGTARGWYQSVGGFEHNAVLVSDFSFTQNFNPYNNELCRIEYTLPENALFLLQAGQHENFETYTDIVNWEVRAKGHYAEYWDGRDRNGDILAYYSEAYPLILGCQTESLPENSVVVTGAQAGSTNVLSDPYCFIPSFGEFTNISFSISSSGTVSVSICKPSGELVKTLLDNVSKSAGTYTLTWDGKDANGKIVSKDDNYIIKADFTGADGKAITRYGNITTR